MFYENGGLKQIMNYENTKENAVRESDQTATCSPTLSGENQAFGTLAATKIAAELESFQGGSKEKAVSKFVASTLTHFCEENERFAQAVYRTSRTLSDCCAEIMDGCGSQISDIDVYRAAVQSYFPNADVFFRMEIHITGDAPGEGELSRPSKKTVPEPKKTYTASNSGREITPAAKSTEVIQLTLFD
jgi:hypothetical protein